MIIDGGGRGQALAMKLNPECSELFVSPGNPGNEEFAYSTGIAPTDIRSQLEFAKRNKVDLTIVGADDPLALGIVDEFSESSLTIFGPTKDQARIEWDKSFAKKVALREGIPIGHFAHFDNPDEAVTYAKTCNWPQFLKDNDLAQGKGVTRCDNIEEFEIAARKLKNMVAEDYVKGPEISLTTFGDGKDQITPPFLIRDHKNVGENDTGPMTGGMGTIGPLPNYTLQEVEALGQQFAEPIIRKLGFKGLLFTGLKGIKGFERSLEWNARFGDPEAQVFMKLMKSPLIPLLIACIEGDLKSLQPLDWYRDKYITCLALCAPDYPMDPRKGLIIEGIEDAESMPNIDVLHAATKRLGSSLVVDGGRVLNVIAEAKSIDLAIKSAYEASARINFNGDPPLIRPDIGRTLIT